MQFVTSAGKSSSKTSAERGGGRGGGGGGGLAPSPAASRERAYASQHARHLAEQPAKHTYTHKHTHTHTHTVRATNNRNSMHKRTQRTHRRNRRSCSVSLGSTQHHTRRWPAHANTQSDTYMAYINNEEAHPAKPPRLEAAFRGAAPIDLQKKRKTHGLSNAARPAQTNTARPAPPSRTSAHQHNEVTRDETHSAAQHTHTHTHTQAHRHADLVFWVPVCRATPASLLQNTNE